MPVVVSLIYLSFQLALLPARIAIHLASFLARHSASYILRLLLPPSVRDLPAPLPVILPVIVEETPALAVVATEHIRSPFHTLLPMAPFTPAGMSPPTIDSPRRSPPTLGPISSSNVTLLPQNTNAPGLTATQLFSPPVVPGTPDESSFDSKGFDSTLSTPYELDFGIQSTPFPLRRRPLEPSPTKAPSLPPTIATPLAITKENESDKVEEKRRDKEGSEPELPKPKVVLSSWRIAQMKKEFIGKRVGTGPARPIPALHGPLSLPYARNPSGVDATVADDTAYLSHVFGLRAAPSVQTGTASDSSDSRHVSSGTDSTRTVSGSSGTSNPMMAKKGDRSTASDGSSLISAGGTHSRPMVVRDPNQIIGLKRDVALTTNVVKEKIADRGDDEIVLAKPQNDPMGREIATPGPRYSTLRAQLGFGKPLLSPIPASPIAKDDEFTQLFDDAVLIPNSPFSAIGTASRLWTHSSTAGSRIPSNESQPTSDGFVDPIIYNPATIPVPVPQFKKADLSENWRARPHSDVARAVLKFSPPKAKPDDPFEEILTMDRLFERFEKAKLVSDKDGVRSLASSVKVNIPGSDSLSTRKVKIIDQDIVMTEPTPPRLAPSPKSQTIHDLEAITSPINVTRTALAKGTPGAGKLLRKQTGGVLAAEAAMEPMPPVLGSSRLVKGKGKARMGGK
ncbi:hypothetical protein P7C73_g3637, partial [Tremellales sp. Uapishka_1]